MLDIASIVKRFALRPETWLVELNGSLMKCQLK
jgi:hypothetical protein